MRLVVEIQEPSWATNNPHVAFYKRGGIGISTWGFGLGFLFFFFGGDIQTYHCIKGLG